MIVMVFVWFVELGDLYVGIDEVVFLIELLLEWVECDECEGVLDLG